MKYVVFVTGLVTASSLVYSCGKKSSSDPEPVPPAVVAPPAANPPAAVAPVTPVAPAAPVAPAPVIHPVVPVVAPVFTALGLTNPWLAGSTDKLFPINNSVYGCKSFAQINEAKQKAAFGYYCYSGNSLTIHVQAMGDIVSEASGNLIMNQTSGCDTAHNATQVTVPYTFVAAVGSSGATFSYAVPGMTNAVPPVAVTAQTLYKYEDSRAISGGNVGVGCINRTTNAYTADAAMSAALAAFEVRY